MNMSILKILFSFLPYGAYEQSMTDIRNK